MHLGIVVVMDALSFWCRGVEVKTTAIYSFFLTYTSSYFIFLFLMSATSSIFTGKTNAERDTICKKFRIFSALVAIKIIIKKDDYETKG